MSIQEQDHALQKPDSFLLPPTVSDTENDVLNYNNLTTSPIVKVPPWIGINSQSKLWLHCECTYADGRGGVIELAEAVPVGDASDASTFSCELPLDELAKLGDNTNLVIILMVSNNGTIEKQSVSSIRYNLMFQHPIALIDYSRWMTNIGSSLEHLKIRDLILPLAHNAGVDQEGAGWPADWWAACQDDSFAYQLNNGIRALDLRLFYSGVLLYRFEHNGYHAGRRLEDCAKAVLNFSVWNPGEIVILDFHEVSLGAQENIVFRDLLSIIGDRCIPSDAHDMTIKQIRSRYPGKNIVIAWSYAHHLCWRKVHQTWTGRGDNNAGQISMHMQDIWSKPLPTGLWSMFACGYDAISGPIRYKPSAIFWDRFFSVAESGSYRQPTRGNMIQIDFFAGTGAVERCINATRNRANKAAQSVASHFRINQIGPRDVQLEWESPAETERLSGYNIFQNGTFLATIPTHPRKYSITGIADGRTHHFQVIAKFTDGIGAVAEATIAIPDITNPSKPDNLKIFRIESTPPRHFLTWGRSTDNVAVDHYEIYRNNESIPIGNTESATFEIYPIIGDTYVVRAVDTSGYHADSDPIIAIDDIPPSKPANLRATFLTGNAVSLAWDKSTDNVGMIGYQVFRDDVPSPMMQETSYLAIGLAQGTTYRFRVRALDAAGNFADSETLPITVKDTIAPSKPTNFRASSIVANTAYLEWDESTDNVGVAGYQIFRDTTPITTVTSTHYSAGGLVEGRPYVFKVRALDAAGNFADSDPWRVYIDFTRPSKPTNLRVTALADNSATLEWAASSDNIAVTGYQIFRNNDPIDTINNTRYTASGLTPGISYIFKVRALDAAGNYDDSDPLTVKILDDTTAPSKPSEFSAYHVSHNFAILDWKAATDNVGVTRHIIFQNDEWLANIDSTDAYIRYMAMNLEGGTKYVFKICAVDAAGNTGDFEYLTVYTSGLNPNAPTILQFHRLAGQVGTIQWEPPIESDDVTGYELSRDGHVIQEISELAFTLTDLTAGDTYLFEVRSIRDGKYSDPASIRG